LKNNDALALDALDLPRDRPVVTVCALGRTSRKAAKLLEQRGYEVHSLEGGMQAFSLAWNTATVPLHRSVAQVLQIRRAGKGCLSYLLFSQGVAAVIDPSLDPEVYLRLATQRGLKITAVLDTHVHADHVSRSPALATLTGAKHYLPAGANAKADGYLGEDETIPIGSVRLAALRTPGHTPESTCYRLGDEALFTGDTLFLNAVGRPDLAAAGVDPRSQARDLHRSLRRLADLPQSLLVLPAHHSVPPAFDGKPITATLADVKAANSFLQKSEAEFLRDLKTADAPPNHLRIMGINLGEAVPEGDWAALEAGPNRCAAG
jgi:glyoxylase-like metal-dependent hydrolase (beta-lactamase superfamily II)